MKIPKVLRENLLLKMTSLNAAVISIRLVISLFIQRFLAELVGEEGISKIGQLRNFTVLLTATSTGGIFNGVTKYVSEFKNDQEQLQKMFSTAFVFHYHWDCGNFFDALLPCDFFKPLFVWY